MGTTPKATTLTPTFIWAQRKDQIFLTLEVPNVKPDSAKIEISDEGRIYFKGLGGNVGREMEYMLDIMLLKPIKTAESKSKINARSVVFKIVKADSGPYWERLLKKEGRNVHCKIDWDNWVEEDEEKDNEYSFGSQFSDSKDHDEMDFVTGDSSSEEDESPPPSEDAEPKL